MSESPLIKMPIILFSALCLVGLVILIPNSEAMNLDQLDSVGSGKPTVTLAVIENPDFVIRVLDSLLRSVVYSASVDFQSTQNGQKRGLDLGMSRGFSGSQAGKHLLGLSAASFANGPGRK